MIVWSNGCFDVLHVGHVRMLEYARSLGTKLVVGVDKDIRVRSNKGENRPFNNEDDRVEMLKSLKCVDEVVKFSTDQELLQAILDSGAEIVVVGEEYTGRVIMPEHLIFVPFTRQSNYSSTRVIDDIIRSRN